MSAIKFLIFVAVAIACVFAADERVKKDVLVGASPYAYSAYSGYPAAPLAYSAPLGYSAGYHAGYVAPAAIPAAYSAYSAYPYGAGYVAPAAPAYRAGLYY